MKTYYVVVWATKVGARVEEEGCLISSSQDRVYKVFHEVKTKDGCEAQVGVVAALNTKEAYRNVYNGIWNPYTI